VRMCLRIKKTRRNDAPSVFNLTESHIEHIVFK
jgi:hypothetical protein